ncbi:MAG: ATP-dependent DNA helicase [Candidatus Gracilibacteria bacterium]|jgi:DNA helicase-2/ATP-dependent DNA helicase PcrA
MQANQEKFLEEFSRLNPAQREAAEAIEGPVLIVAGPGSGKTQTLALRLANILKKTQAKPHNLLALTFTESGAIALKKRLASIIGSDAYGITATTFHSFCARLHSIFPAEFATTRERIQIDELLQQQLFREILAKGNFPLLRPLRAADLYLRDIASAISNLKREGISPARLLEISEGEKAELATQERINPRTKKPLGRILEAEKRIAKNLELADFYASYQTELEEKGFTDYDDLILSVVEKLNRKDDEFLLAYLQENYLYIVVDEFQDTNGAQNALLQAWGSYDSKPNLCVVGDDDQSIYRFQGASLANILEFTANYPETKIVTLTKNYRSTQTILDASSAVIRNNTERLVNKIPGISKDLVAENSLKDSPLITLAEAGSEADEASFIVNEIRELLKQKENPSEIVVIYRNRFHGDLLADFLAREGIPIHRADGQNALLNPRVKQLLALLKSVENPADSVALLSVLFADFTTLPPVEVYKLAKAASRRDSLLDVMLSEEASGVARELGEKLVGFQKNKAELNLLELTENIAAVSGLTHMISEKKEYKAAEALTAFLSFTRNFAINREEPTLRNFLADIAAMQSQNISLPLPIRATEAITLTTAHRAKGLEWKHVFIIRAEDNAWSGKGKREMLKLPPLTAEIAEVDDEKEKRVEDERRLFFVALTRARSHLTISIAASYSFREVSPSRFIAEISPKHLQKIAIPPSAFSALPTAATHELDPESRKFLSGILAEFRLSPTALNNYLSCPKRFLFENLLHLPTFQTVEDRMGMIFGSAMHSAFEDYFREFKRSGKLPSEEIALVGLHRSLDREPLTSNQRKLIERDAIPALEKYLKFHREKFTPPVEVEYDFSKHDIHLEEIPLTGKIDRIDLIPETRDEVSFIDYKSMKPLTSAQIRGETANSTGDAYRQLLFYLLLAKLDNRFIFKAKTVGLSFIRPDHQGEFHEEFFSPREEEVEDLKKVIRENFTKIQNLEFPCCEEKADCSRCAFREICGES